MVIRPNYLRQYDDDLDGALGLVIHDLVATNAMSPDDAGAAVRIRAELRLQGDFHTDEPAGETALAIAEEVQQDLIDGVFFARPRMVTWPQCPQHPNHPLWLGSPGVSRPPPAFGAETVWICPTTHEAIAELGGL